MSRVCAAAVLLCLLWPATSRAGSNSSGPSRASSARELFGLGHEAYEQAEYLEAAARFEQADLMAPSARAIEYAIRAHEKLGRLDRAATLAALALERHPAEPNIQRLASELLERARRELFTLTVHCDAPCTLSIDEAIVHGGPRLSHVVFLLTGAPLVRAKFANGASASQGVAALSGEELELRFAAPRAPLPAGNANGAPQTDSTLATSESKPSIYVPSSGLSPTFFWVGVGLTLATGAAATWSAVDYVTSPGTDLERDDCAGCVDRYVVGAGKQRRTNILFGVTGALGAGTLVLGALFTDWLPDGQSPGARVTPSARTGLSWKPWMALGEGVFAGAEGRF